jgi:hypothetical protein
MVCGCKDSTGVFESGMQKSDGLDRGDPGVDVDEEI